MEGIGFQGAVPGAELSGIAGLDHAVPLLSHSDQALPSAHKGQSSLLLKVLEPISVITSEQTEREGPGHCGSLAPHMAWMGNPPGQLHCLLLSMCPDKIFKAACVQPT